jgi:hypothetical protein
MEHLKLEQILTENIKTHSQQWEQFFEGKLLLVRSGESFSEYAFVYQNKIWYGEEDNGSGVCYSECKEQKIIPLLLDSKTRFYVSNLEGKMEKVIKKREEGFVLDDRHGKYEFMTMTKANWVSNFDPNEKISCDMYDLGEQFASMIMDPDSWKYVKK